MKILEPVQIHHGSGTRRAVVLSPVLPLWDEGRFFEPLVQPLVNAGYRVSIFDTLSMLTAQPQTLAAFAACWSSYLSEAGPVDLLAGSALGGAVVQAMLCDSWVATVPKALLISAPSVADDTLDARLGALARLARAGELARALELLDRLVLPEGMPFQRTPVAVSPDAQPSQAARLAQGFDLLHEIDVRTLVERYAGRLLNVYGERSQLVRRENVHAGTAHLHHVCAIPKSGMRPLADGLAYVLRAMREHLHIEVPLPV